MPILQKPIKGSFVIIHWQDSDFQIPHRIGSLPIDSLSHEFSDYFHQEHFMSLHIVYLIEMVFERSA